LPEEGCSRYGECPPCGNRARLQHRRAAPTSLEQIGLRRTCSALARERKQ